MSKSLRRKSTNIDMTPFVDIAFLILTFFILATKFKPQEAIKVTPPSSVSMTELKQDTNSFIILFDAGGNVFVQLSKDLRQPVLKKLYEQFGIILQPKAARNFEKIGEINTTLTALNSYYLLPNDIKAKSVTGIDMTEETGADLTALISMVNTISQKNAIYYLKGDNAAKYPVFKKVVKALTDNNIHKFNLITISEPIPAGSPLGLKMSNYNKKQKP